MFHLFVNQFSLLAQQSGSEGSGASLLITLVLVGGAMYLFLFLPQRRRQKAAADLRSSLEVGDRVRTAGGIVGTIRELGDPDVRLEVDAGTTLTIARSAIIQKLNEDT